jgi:hypothetical protein
LHVGSQNPNVVLRAKEPAADRAGEEERRATDTIFSKAPGEEGDEPLSIPQQAAAAVMAAGTVAGAAVGGVEAAAAAMDAEERLWGDMWATCFRSKGQMRAAGGGRPMDIWIEVPRAYME